MNIENRPDKKELIYNKEVDPGLLMEEIYNCIPELKPIVNSDGTFTINLRMFTNGIKLILWAPEEIYIKLIDDAVSNHKIINIVALEEGVI